MIDRGRGLGVGADSDPTLAELTEEITRKLQSGEIVDIEAYADSHPQCAGSIRELLPTMHKLVELGKAVTSDGDENQKSASSSSSTRKSSH